MAWKNLQPFRLSRRGDTVAAVTLHRFIVRPRSPWGSPLRSDTLYGLLLYRIAENEGAKACTQAIESFRDGEPLFVMSSAMPQNCLPMPNLPPVPREEFRKQVKHGNFGQASTDDDPLFTALQNLKKFRKSPWLPLEAWQECREALSMSRLFVWHRQNDSSRRGHRRSMGELAFEPHVSIDRGSNRAIQGELFFTRLRYFDTDAALHLYARVTDADYLLNLLREVGSLGFGKDASTGNGRFDVERDAAFDPASVEPAGMGSQRRAWMLLSVCAAPEMSSLDGWYRTEVKRGKTGPRAGNPFKNPFLMLREGAVLKNMPGGPFVLDGINQDPAIVQITHPLCLPCCLALEE